MSALRLPIAGHIASMTLALVFLTVTLTLYSPLQLWVMLLALCAVLVRMALYAGWYNRAPSSRTINLLALLSGVTLAWFSTDLGLLLSMINLLAMACSLKLMLMTRRKDFLQLFASTLFLIGCGFIFSQSLVNTVMYLALLAVLLLALTALFSPGRSLTRQARSLAVSSAQALPIAIILFLLLPHLSPLWKMPTAKSSTTGLAESVTPGDIANLSQSDELVFNATFDSPLPMRQERYWRAITLEHFDGRTWSVSPTRKQIRNQYQLLNREFEPAASGRAFTYQVIAEATGQRWLYAIDIAQVTDQGRGNEIWQGADYQLIARRPLMSKMAYDVKSYPDVQLNQTLLTLDSRLNLQLPVKGNPATQRWVSQLRQRYPGDAAFIQQLLGYFVQEGFRYTLSPDPMPLNPVDAFLFDKQAGFCTHYASAMAYSLRLAGIPARIVTGYHGGEPIQENVLSVRQYDAHAWVEAIIDDRGWVRFDPTSVVSPARVSFGLQQALEENGDTLNSPFDGLYSMPLFGSVRLFLANTDYLWSRWVLGFDADMQQNLLQKLLGELTPRKLLLFFLAVVGGLALLLASYFLPRWQPNTRPEHYQVIDRAEQLLTKHTGIKRVNQPLHAYQQTLTPHLSPASCHALKTLVQDFEHIEYAGKAFSKARLKAMKRARRDLTKALRSSS
ncbi:DUF3488 and transglutaminase-like domain-containing protein [Alteromonas sp. ASW11-19]|uniref:DUF3488 and transglutaminase-like domain-containing protein n=1 Tax=Alteromonas salexigens TaxID=2982530 RepID=A0ABT2VLY8_9ALTE|nr:DUF3488 and transglutaminase-like domain-containing protein [Alteromonas salexigens]MCU7553847.1 DUF3488 and transglutaminase-like domain-containing protein [Alteromonas salexigens]